MITPDGWFDFAQRVPGPAGKLYSQQNSAEWFIPHSAVGYYPGWASRLFSQDKDATNRYTPYAAVSIHGWNAYDGTFKQHYPVTASCWGSGSFTPNTRAIAIENEGGPPGNESEPLTGAQKLTIVRILSDLAEWKGVGLDYWQRPTSAQDATATLYEHRECVRFGSDPTACPSSRIDWVQILGLLEDEMGRDDRPYLLTDWAWDQVMSNHARLTEYTATAIYAANGDATITYDNGKDAEKVTLFVPKSKQPPWLS